MTPIGDKLASTIIAQLQVNADYSLLTAAQQLQYQNMAQQSLNAMVNAKEKSDYVVNNLSTSAAIGYTKFYATNLTQVGTNAPIAIPVFTNTYRAPIVWTRASARHYIGTLAGAFRTDGGTKIDFANVTDIIGWSILDADRIEVETNADSVLSSRWIGIKTW
jgi:hypothetical protein